MAFKLTEGYVDLTVHNQMFNRAMRDVKGVLNSVNAQADKLKKTLRRLFIPVVGFAAAFASVATGT